MCKSPNIFICRGSYVLYAICSFLLNRMQLGCVFAVPLVSDCQQSDGQELELCRSKTRAVPRLRWTTSMHSTPVCVARDCGVWLGVAVARDFCRHPTTPSHFRCCLCLLRCMCLCLLLLLFLQAVILVLIFPCPCFFGLDFVCNLQNQLLV